MAIDDNASYELTGYQVKDLAQKIRAKADSSSLAPVATSGLYSDITGAPTIPTVYNGTLTIQQDGTTLGTFSANQDTNETINITGGGASYTAGSGIDITNNEISVDTSVVATQTDLGNYVTLGTNQNITGEKTFVGNKRIKFKGTASNSKLGFTTFDQNNGETGFLEVEGASTASKKVRLGCYDAASGSARDNYLGFQYHNTKPVGGGTVSYNLVCPPQYKGVSGTNAFAYIPVDFTDGNTTVRSDTNGIVDLSTLLPTYSGFTGATSSVAGSDGLVPAPAAGDNTAFLRGDGTWAVPTSFIPDYGATPTEETSPYTSTAHQFVRITTNGGAIVQINGKQAVNADNSGHVWLEIAAGDIVSVASGAASIYSWPGRWV